MSKRYWVVGGTYRCTAFSQLEEAPTALGPYSSYDEARKVWHERSMATRPIATARYSIAVEPFMAAAS